jgi:hypothetical protein
VPTQTLIVDAVVQPGTVALRTFGSGTTVATSTTIAAFGECVGRWTAEFTNVLAGRYIVECLDGSAVLSIGEVELTETTASFRVYEAVDAAAISGDETAANNLESAADGTGYNLGGGLVRVLDSSGNAVAPAATALSNAVWTNARAGYLDKLNVTGTLAHSDAAALYRADVSGLATAADLAIVDTVVDAIKAKTDNLPADPAGLADLEAAHGAGSWQTATGFSTLTQADVRTAVGLATANLDSQLDSISGKADTLLSRITSTLFSGITSLAQWLGLIAGKQPGDATARAELRATGAGSGTYDETTDSLEALRDRGDAAWVTATGFSTHSAADVWSVATRTLTSGSGIVLQKGVGITGFNDLSAAQVNAEVDAALADYGTARTSDIAALQAHGDSNWATADVSGLLTASDFAAALPANFAALGINASGHISRVTLVDTTTTNTDMRGTDGAYTGTPPTAAEIAAQVRTELTTELGRIDAAISSRLAASAYTPPPTAVQNADALLDRSAAIDGKTPREALRIIAATTAGKVSGAGTGTEVFKGLDGTTTRVTVTTDEDSNRTQVTYG